MQYFLTIIILLIIFRRPLLRYLAKYMAKRFQKAAQQGGFGFQEQKQQSSSHNDGETFISTNKKRSGVNNSSGSTEGDYVDFEEV